ncbi:secretin N-terminal domain-containing protein [Thermodesulfobacteriota bacterium]
MINRKTITLLIFILSIFTFTHISQAEVEIFKIQFRLAPEVVPMIEPLLSPEGRVSVDRRTNSILVSDSPEAIEKIRSFLTGMDKPVEQVTVRFKFREENQSDSRELSASGRVSGDDWSISVGKRPKDGVSVHARDESRDRSRGFESFIKVVSGSPGYIFVGKDIPFTERWANLCRRYARYGERIVFQRVGTGMEVFPVISGNLVHLDITPIISEEVKGRRGVVRFVDASTKLSVPKGKWVTIGGSSGKTNEVIREILSYGSSSGRSDMTFSLMVE